MKAVILGLGVSGIEAARFLSEKGHSVFIWDDNQETLAKYAAYWPAVGNAQLPEGTDVLVLSPGVPPSHPLVAAAARAHVDIAGEMEIASRYLGDEHVIAVTGTNGKSTTVTLIHEMLEKAGKRSVLAGNIGIPMVTAVGKDYEFMVLEISSYQIETLRSMTPDVALILNVSPDHLDRYASYEEYLFTKVQLGRLLGTEGLLIVNGGDQPLCAAVSGLNREIHYFSARDRSDIISEGSKIQYKGHVIDLDTTKLRGEHNVENVMAAILAVEPFIEDPAPIIAAIQAFNPLPHRMQPVVKIQGVEFIDDSKGTNVGAVEKSLAGFADKSVVLILGGVDKGGSYQPLRTLADRKCRGVVLIGRSAPVIREYFDDFVPLETADSMMGAVETAFRMAEPGTTVLLSPACSSFDWYENYKKRGEDFINRVFELKNRIGG